MKVSTQAAYLTVDRQFTIDENRPVVTPDSLSGGKQVRIYRGVITYVWKDGDWTLNSRWSIDLLGVVLKKDGTESQLDHRTHPEQTSYRADATWTAQYTWIQAVVDLLRPSGDLAMTVLDQTEVGA